MPLFIFFRKLPHISRTIMRFLIIRTDILHAFLVQLLPLCEVKFSQSGPMFVYELYRNGFFDKRLTLFSRRLPSRLL